MRYFQFWFILHLTVFCDLVVFKFDVLYYMQIQCIVKCYMPYSVPIYSDTKDLDESFGFFCVVQCQCTLGFLIHHISWYSSIQHMSEQNLLQSCSNTGIYFQKKCVKCIQLIQCSWFLLCLEVPFATSISVWVHMGTRLSSVVVSCSALPSSQFWMLSVYC